MLKLFRKWKYGDSSKKPLYVKSKDRWLYKNKWVTNDEVIKIICGQSLRYRYIIKNDYYSANSFAEVVDATSKHPLDIEYIMPMDYSVQELETLAAIRTAKAKVYTNKFMEQVKELEEQIKNINNFRF